MVESLGSREKGNFNQSFPAKKKLGVCALPSALNRNDYHTILAGWLAGGGVLV